MRLRNPILQSDHMIRINISTPSPWSNLPSNHPITAPAQIITICIETMPFNLLSRQPSPPTVQGYPQYVHLPSESLFNVTVCVWWQKPYIRSRVPTPLYYPTRQYSPSWFSPRTPCTLFIGWLASPPTGIMRTTRLSKWEELSYEWRRSGTVATYVYTMRSRDLTSWICTTAPQCFARHSSKRDLISMSLSTP